MTSSRLRRLSRDGVVRPLGAERLGCVLDVPGLGVHLGLLVGLDRLLGVLDQALNLIAFGEQQAAGTVLVHPVNSYVSWDG